MIDTDPTEQPSPVPSSQPLVWLAGILIGDAVIVLLYGGGALLLSRSKAFGLLGLPSFFLAPLLGGLVATYVWRKLKPTIGVICVNTLYMTLLALLGGGLVFREGIICLVILSPLFFVALLTGAILGRILFKAYPTRLRVSLLPLLLLGVLGEPLTRAPRESVITDEVLIRAPIGKVWPQVTAFPEIPSPPRFWLFRLGLPYPVATTSEGDFVNASRECVFSKGAIFKEKVVEFEPLTKLTFDIVESPPDPELVGHLTAHRGQFLLHSHPDGTTTLIGSTWYTLHVRPLWYFDAWARHIFRSVHMRVMEDIRHRSEQAR
jgi:hypothetical protein